MTVELYALIDNRRSASARAFLSRFLIDKIAVQEDYPVPHLASEPEHVFLNENDIFDYLERHDEEYHQMYWSEGAEGRDVTQAMSFYTRDAMIIAGLAVVPDSVVVSRCIEELQEHSGRHEILIRLDERPPESGREFLGLARYETIDVPAIVQTAQ